MNEKVSILLSGNDEYRKGLLSVCLSLAMTQKEDVYVYLLTGDFTDIKPNFHKVSEETRHFLEENCARYHSAMHFEVIDCTDLFNKHLRNGKNAKTSFTPYTLLRVLADEIPSLPNRLLYLDGDTVVMKDLKEFMNIDMEGKEYAMARDIVGHHWLGKNYCNAGTILMDMESIRKTKSLAEVREFLNKNFLFMPDQSAINWSQPKNRLILPYIYNEQRKTTSETVIRHYCRMPKFLHFVTVRPWQFAEFRKHFPGENVELVDALESIFEKK